MLLGKALYLSCKNICKNEYRVIEGRPVKPEKNATLGGKQWGGKGGRRMNKHNFWGNKQFSKLLHGTLSVSVSWVGLLGGRYFAVLRQVSNLFYYNIVSE